MIISILRLLTITMNYIIIVTFTIIIKFHRYIINEVAADFAFARRGSVWWGRRWGPLWD